MAIGGRRLLLGAGWTYVAHLTPRIVTFFSTIVLARILGPEAFGAMGAAMIILRYLEPIADAGAGEGMVQRQGDEEAAADAAFTLSLLVGGALAALMFLAAPYAAAFFEQPELTGIIRVLSPVLLVVAAGSSQDAWYRKNFMFSQRVVPRVARSIVRAVVSIALALAGFGVWSLVGGFIAGQVSATLLYWLLSTRRHRLGLNPDVARSLLGFGLHVSMVTLFGVFVETMDQVIVARLFDAALLGIYVLAAMFPELVVMGICYAGSQVAFPAFSKMQNHPRLLRNGYLISNRYITLLCFASAAGLACVAEDFIDLAYSDEWRPAIAVIQVLALGAAVRSIGFNAGDVFKAKGNPGVLNLLTAGRLVLVVPLMLVLSPLGLTGVAIGKTLADLIVTGATIWVAQRMIGFSLREFFLSLRPPLIGMALVACTCILVGILGEEAEIWVRLISKVICGGMVFAFFLVSQKAHLQMRSAAKRR
ncbi:lipopolysaccharide biosynthesis protein [Tropicimonas marinistellae]|uniref:lipopolysaccharide biosynthesis protein n=1 Tax=Tropicimonas marinistellae TaxID=1739787 RepID=UPI000833CD51|nr:lipopolysaccharide biosynthesis protein [Tropicimonas marinistellae]